MPEIFRVCAAGTDAESEALADRELRRIAEELDAAPTQTRARAGSVFTAHLWPRGAAYDPRTLNQDLVPLHFPWPEPTALAKMMRREVDDLYVGGGEDGARHLLASIAYSETVYATGHDLPGSPFRNLVPFSNSQEALEAGRRTYVACDNAIRDVLRRARATLSATEQTALALADHDLQAARAEIHREAERYLDIASAPGADARQILGWDGPLSEVVLRGPDVAALAGALRRIHEQLRALEGAVHALVRTTAAGGPRAPGALAVEAAAQDLAVVVAAEAAGFPILYRVWRDHPLPAGIVAVPADGGSTLTTAPRRGERQSVAEASGNARAIADLQNAIFRTLQRADRANAGFNAALVSDPHKVWRYAPLVARALDAQQVDGPSIAFRAAADELDDVSGMSALATLNLVAGALSIAAGLTAAAPPVALAFAVASAVLGAAETLEDYFRRAEQEDAFNAVLDPGKAVAAAPGYLGIVVGVVFSVLDVKGVMDAVAAARAFRSASAATAAAELVSP
ncbi:hypothetical protein FE374_14310 [Georgenia yuyongxinii]|uniref:Uncharacterized protein n=1 Tax=Georgenia yuyongxinii TaxID=2589797 RepID=A0A5B8C8Z8_9MICO|nr:hypothetical protein [Georgenia yuyongxinii]QDC25622.1 hypothetical protein FE374_14310 [Georgenia yuyongxinii]